MSAFLAVDVHYEDDLDQAWVGAVRFEGWPSESGHTTRILHRGLAPYESGAFYRRELPCLIPVVQAALKLAPLEWVIVDGFVDLGAKPGLGRYLWSALGMSIDVCGVAKNPFRGAPAQAVVRGGSERPLYVSSTADINTTATAVAAMAGPHRIPSLLRKADQAARGLNGACPQVSEPG